MIEVEGWAVVDKKNPTGAYPKGGEIAKVSHVFSTAEEANQHLGMLRCMPEFLHKEWKIARVTILIHNEAEGG